MHRRRPVANVVVLLPRRCTGLSSAFLKPRIFDVNSLKRWPVLVAMTLCAALVGCKSIGGGSSTPSSVSLRVANASLTHPSLDLLVDAVPASAGTASDTVGAYISAPSGGPTLQLNDAGSATALITLAPTLVGGNHYTLLAYESGGVVKASMLSEDFVAPVAGSAQLRVFVAAVDAGKLDVYITDPATDLATLSTPTATSPAITDAFSTGLLTYGPGTYRVRVTGAGNKADLRIDIPAVSLAALQIGTVVLTPASGGVLLNGSTLIQQGAYAATRNTNARVRLAAAVGSGATVSASASAGTQSFPIDTGSAPAFGFYALVPANSALNILVNNQSVGAPATALTAGTDHTLLVYGTPANASATLLADDNRTPSDPSSVKLRLINGITGIASNAALALTANSALVASGILPAGVSAYVAVPGSANPMNLSLTLSTSPGVFYTNNTNVLNFKAVYNVMAGGDVAGPQLLIR